jgi:hypothetical protein
MSVVSSNPYVASSIPSDRSRSKSFLIVLWLLSAISIGLIGFVIGYEVCRIDYYSTPIHNLAQE